MLRSLHKALYLPSWHAIFVPINTDCRISERLTTSTILVSRFSSFSFRTNQSICMCNRWFPHVVLLLSYSNYFLCSLTMYVKLQEFCWYEAQIRPEVNTSGAMLPNDAVEKIWQQLSKSF